MPASRLFNILTFTNVASAGSVATAHGLNQNGTSVIPDFVFVNNQQFSVVADATTVTVTNNGAGVATTNVLVWYMHSYIRNIDAVAALSPDPWYLIAAGAGGGSGGVDQTFVYTATGAEGSDFSVTLPLARATDTYVVFPALDGVTAIVGIDTPDTLAGDRTTTQFRVVTSSSLTAGDKISFLVKNPT